MIHPQEKAKSVKQNLVIKPPVDQKLPDQLQREPIQVEI
jgi:hypothetical protein